ncbi:hypothetical protein EQW76_18855 [Rhizobium sp. rho-13.1]|nr:hypothetical protein EQW76_18855 [Rhizobium sp. rho-13.1]TQY11686.1 hypothetical protein EQW74_17105 [Rhizobium sp. rho-1.1]
MSQESSTSKSLDVGWFVHSLTAQTRRGWIPVTSTGMREDTHRCLLPAHSFPAAGHRRHHSGCELQALAHDGAAEDRHAVEQRQRA